MKKLVCVYTKMFTAVLFISKTANNPKKNMLRLPVVKQ